MRKFKNLVALGLVVAMTTMSYGLEALAFDIEDIKDINPYGYNETVEQITIRITDEEDIKEYLKQTGQEYEPNLVEIFTTIDKDALNTSENIPDKFFIGREYYIKNKRVSKRVDTSHTLREYRRPAGTITLNETVSVSNKYTATGGVTSKILSAQLGYEVNDTESCSITWSATYSYPTRIVVHPLYEDTRGEIWDRDIKYDDFVGNFNASRAIGSDVKVYRN